MPDLRFPKRRVTGGKPAPARGGPQLLALLLTAMVSLGGSAQERSGSRVGLAPTYRTAQAVPVDQPAAAELRVVAPPPPAENTEALPPVDATIDSGVPQEPRRERIPLLGLDPTEQIEVTSEGGNISLIVREAPLNRVLEVIAHRQGVNIVTTEEAAVRVSITLRNVSLDKALSAVLGIAGFTWVEHNNIILVSRVSGGSSIDSRLQGRVLRIFELDFAAAEELEPVVRGMLSPVGKAFVNSSNPADNRRTKEILTVEDLPAALERIEQYVAQLDQPPRQVLIEARVLAVDLSDENKHGVNWHSFTEIAGVTLDFQSVGFATPVASAGGPTTFATFSTGNFNTLIECLKTTTDAKTLAAPKVLVINGQEARMQVGEQLGFRVTTTTETSTLENVNFLDVGVVLRVIPRITRDGSVLMHVKPEVSSGEVNAITGLPEEETTEIETDVLLQNGQGVVIGGLIQEKIVDTQNKSPWLGDRWVIGRLFQKRQFDKSRTEIIIALIPHIVCNNGASPRPVEQVEAERAFTPIVQGPLERFPRPWEPSLYDAIDNPMPRGEYLQRIPPPPGPIERYYDHSCVQSPSADPRAVVPANPPGEYYIEPIAPGVIDELPPQSRTAPNSQLSLLPPVEAPRRTRATEVSPRARWAREPQRIQR
jgi:hypothetical protein